MNLYEKSIKNLEISENSFKTSEHRQLNFLNHSITMLV